MKQKPILFNGEMVRATLDGRKTQTRRIVKWMENNQPVNPDCFKPELFTQPCPYGQPGDRLWVRESFAERTYLKNGETKLQIIYRQQMPLALNGNGQPLKWKPSIHMPRWASRITLEIVNVRVERLQDISNQDCAAEGFSTKAWRKEDVRNELRLEFQKVWDTSMTGGFKVLPLNENPKSWDKNPWVWVIEFKKES